MDHRELASRIEALTEDESDTVALIATVACEVHWPDVRFDWTGFYRVVAPELLKIGPNKGGHVCLVIPISRGVCGTAAREGVVQIVDDVRAFPGHIACSSTTKSDLVLPERGREGRLIGVSDIDSDQSGAFTRENADTIQQVLDATFAVAA